MKMKRIVSMLLCSAMFFIVAVGWSCASTDVVEQTSRPNAGGVHGTRAVQNDKPVRRIGKSQLKLTDEELESLKSRGSISFYNHGEYREIKFYNYTDNLVIEDPLNSENTLFAVKLEFMPMVHGILEEECDDRLQCLTEYLIRMNKYFQDKGYDFEWIITYSDMFYSYDTYITGFVTAEQLLNITKSIESNSMWFEFGEVLSSTRVNVPLEEHERIVASSSNLTQEQIAAALEKSSEFDYRPHVQQTQIPSETPLPRIKYDIDGKRILYASDLPTVDNSMPTSHYFVRSGVFEYLNETTKQFINAKENEDALFAVQTYVYYSISKNRTYTENAAIKAAKAFSEEYGCPLNWCVGKVEGKECYYAFLYGYLTAEQILNCPRSRILGSDINKLALANVDNNGDFIIDIFNGVTIVSAAK